MPYQEIAVFVGIALLFQVRNHLMGESGSCQSGFRETESCPSTTPAVNEESKPLEGPPALILTKGDKSDWDGLLGGASEHVVQLFEPSIQPYIASRSQWLLIMFYIPSCEYSAPAQTEFASAAKQMHDEAGDKIIFASVNCDFNPETCKNQKIEGYPTFYLFYKGKYVNEYMDIRLQENFVKYAQNPAKPWFFSGWF